ncbi:MAG TPA: hypothetical protein VFA33_24795 [Bryobacteraceae bacterium]|nr:hypothetical protein [Bryobacteraceae bacterium]
MRLSHFLTTGILAGAMAALPVISLAGTSGACTSAAPTAESSHWNFQQEASQLLDDIQMDASHAANRADELQSLYQSPTVDWLSHATQLNNVRDEVNDMGNKLCRLETIRRVLPPWQQKAVDDAAPLVRLMADNAQDAITFLNGHQEELWEPVYDKYINNLSTESRQLSRSMRNFEEYAKVHHEDRNLGKSLGMTAGQ